MARSPQPGLPRAAVTVATMSRLLPSTLILAIALFTAAFAAAGTPSPSSLRDDEPSAASSVRLGGCPGTALSGFRCGRLTVPFERADPGLGTTPIAFAMRPRSDRSRPSLGTIFAAEGGPGYSSTGSASEYVATFGKLLNRRALVLVDQRGTGMSRALHCPGSQAAKVSDQVILARCAAELGPRFESYRTSAGADDLAAVRRALGLGRIVLYGDSYGTYLAQSYAYRHGKTLKALVLDSAYPTSGESPWYPSGPRTGLRSLKLSCARSPKCHGDARARLGRAVHKLRKTRRGAVPLADLIWSAGYTPPQGYLKVNNAVSGLSRGDSKLYDRLTKGGGGGYGAVKAYSHAEEMVVSCNDYPMLWKKDASEPQRRLQLKRSIAAYPAKRFAPFTPAEIARSIFINYRYCLTAPAPGPFYEPPQAAGAKAPGAPVLVVSGEMDDVTTATEGRYTAQPFPHARQFIPPNAGHVNALYYPRGPAARKIRAFVGRHG
ncbi:MAG: alpha/beta fold hydrolase [Solirubrobacterales bacterium]|nr:alpha/beta fold hydrolase [Solirubrobacterales bacterium]